LFAEGGAIVLICVGPAVDPDEGEGIGGVVAVLHPDEAVQGMFGIIQGDVDGIVHPLLPIVCFLSICLAAYAQR
jgi:hypothetical protein